MILSFSALGQGLSCLDKLLPFNRHSGVHQITSDEWTDGGETLTPENAAIAVSFLANSKLFCRSNELVIKLDPVCERTIFELPESNSCFIFTNLGYFIISRDGGRNTNFIFTKDKRYSEAI